MTAQNDIDTRLAELLEVIKDADQRQVGYPTNQIFDYSVSIFMVIRPAIFTDIQPPWEFGELTIIRL